MFDYPTLELILSLLASDNGLARTSKLVGVAGDNFYNELEAVASGIPKDQLIQIVTGDEFHKTVYVEFYECHALDEWINECFDGLLTDLYFERITSG